MRRRGNDGYRWAKCFPIKNELDVMEYQEEDPESHRETASFKNIKEVFMHLDFPSHAVKNKEMPSKPQHHNDPPLITKVTKITPIRVVHGGLYQ